MPSRHSFFGFAGPVDGARGELTRQGAPISPASRYKGQVPEAGCGASRALGATRGEVSGPREEATQRCDSATPSFIPPLNKRAARKPPQETGPPSRHDGRSTEAGRSHLQRTGVEGDAPSGFSSSRPAPCRQAFSLAGRQTRSVAPRCSSSAVRASRVLEHSFAACMSSHGSMIA